MRRALRREYRAEYYLARAQENSTLRLQSGPSRPIPLVKTPIVDAHKKDISSNDLSLCAAEQRACGLLLEFRRQEIK